MKYAQHARLLPPPSLRVSVADKVHNTYSILRDLRTSGEQVWERYEAGPDDVLEYYQTLVHAYREAGGGRLVDELERLLAESSGRWATDSSAAGRPDARAFAAGGPLLWGGGAPGWPGAARVGDGRTAEGRVFWDAFESESP